MDTNNQNPYGQNNSQTGYSGVFGEQTQTQGTGQQNPYGQTYYQQNGYQSYSPNTMDETVSVLDWVGTILLQAVPCVGLIMYCIWAFSADTKPSKANYCKAYLIIFVVILVLYIVVVASMFAMGLGYLFSF